LKGRIVRDWQNVLAKAGYPTDILCLDFETYFDSEYSLGKLSTIEYINDLRFELTGLGTGNKTDFTFWQPCDIQGCIDLVKECHSKYTILIQNARFDITILQEKFGIVPKYIVDLKDLAKHYDSRMSHKLKDMAKMFGLPPKGETQNFKGLCWDKMTKEQRQALREYTINDVELETELAKILLLKLTNPKEELALARHTLGLWLHQRLRVDFDLAKQLKVQMRAKIAQAVQQSELTPTQLRSQKFAHYLQEALPPGEKVPMKEGKRGNIPALAKTDEACQQLLIHPDPKVRNLVAARVAVKSWPTHIKRVESIVVQAKANGGLLRVPLNYYGGHTGRWSGGEGYNLQNLGAEGRGGQEHDPLIGQVKTCLLPLEGCVPCTIDSAQIEARIVAWLAGQNDLVKGFADGEDVYSVFATELFGCQVRKPRSTDPKLLAIALKIKRGFGKDTILGCGYGMGANKFYTNCMANTALRPLFDSGEYNFAFIKKLIDTYRTTYSKIPEYWNQVERAFRLCIQYPHLEPEIGCCKFYCRGNTVHIRLPSGRVLYYRHARVDKKKTIKYIHGPLWGGSITENIDQSIARDLLGWWILEAEKAELPIFITIHDDVRLMSPEAKADEQAETLAQIMRSVPGWASGLPVDVDIQRGKLL
jgi:DNA polymerase